MWWGCAVSYSSDCRGGCRGLHCVPAEFIIRVKSRAPDRTYIILHTDTSLYAPSCMYYAFIYTYTHTRDNIYERGRSILRGDFRIKFTCVILYITCTNHRRGSPQVWCDTHPCTATAVTGQLLHIINRRCDRRCTFSFPKKK